MITTDVLHFTLARNLNFTVGVLDDVLESDLTGFLLLEQSHRKSCLDSSGAKKELVTIWDLGLGSGSGIWVWDLGSGVRVDHPQPN